MTARTLYSAFLLATIALITASLLACGGREFIPSTPPTPHPLPESVTGVSIFKEIDTLGELEFNNYYAGHRFEISVDWNGSIENTRVYGVAVIERPSNALEFMGRGEGDYWTLNHTKPHDGKIIVGKFLYGREPHVPTYHCIVKDYVEGTLTLDRCVPKK